MNRSFALIASLSACLVFSPISSRGQAPPALRPPPLASGAVQYYYDDFGRAEGPLSLAEVIQLIKFDKIYSSTTMWKSNSPTRVFARDLPELNGPPWGGPCGGANQVIWTTFHRVAGHDDVYFDEGTKLKIKPPAGKWSGKTFSAKLPETSADGSKRVDSYEACMGVQAPHIYDNAGATYASLLFGVTHDGEGYELDINALGQVAVFDDKSPGASLLSWTFLDGVKTGQGAVNVLQVVVKGRAATLFVNGRQLNLPPVTLKDDQTSVGYGSGSERTRPDAWKFLWLAGTQEH